MPSPKTSYAKNGDVNIAYQVLGEGPPDLVYVWGWLSHLDFQWTDPTVASFLRRLASFSRLINFDKRGTGPLGPARLPPLTFDDRMDDIGIVMDAVASERAALLGLLGGRRAQRPLRGHTPRARLGAGPLRRGRGRAER